MKLEGGTTREAVVRCGGEGNQTRSFCYVDNLIDGLVRLMGTSAEVTGPINMGNPNEFTIRELAESVIQLTGSKSRLVNRPLPQDDPKQRQPDLTLAKKHLGWSPRQSLKEGLVPTVQYFEKMLSNEKLRQTLLASGAS